MSFGRRSLKAQMKQANSLDARSAVILGEDELASGTVTVRSLSTGEQRSIPEDELVQDLAGEQE
jgi:histidyl-tRNA synthetase